MRAEPRPLAAAVRRRARSWSGGASRSTAKPYTVIGVLPPAPGSWAGRSRRICGCRSSSIPAHDYRESAGRYLQRVARLKPGVTRERPRPNSPRSPRGSRTPIPTSTRGWSVNLFPLPRAGDGPGAAAAAGAGGRRRARAAHRLRQRRQPAARPGHARAPRDRGAGGARRKPRPDACASSWSESLLLRRPAGGGRAARALAHRRAGGARGAASIPRWGGPHRRAALGFTLLLSVSLAGLLRGHARARTAARTDLHDRSRKAAAALGRRRAGPAQSWWPRRWRSRSCCWWAPGCCSRASLGCSRWTSASSPTTC